MVRRDAPGKGKSSTESRESSEAALPLEVDEKPFGGVGQRRLAQVGYEPLEVVDSFHNFTPSSPVGGAVAFVRDDVNVNPGSGFELEVARTPEDAAEGSLPAAESCPVEEAARVGIFGLESEMMPLEREERELRAAHGEPTNPSVSVLKGATDGGAAVAACEPEEIGSMARVAFHVGSRLAEKVGSARSRSEVFSCLLPAIAGKHDFTGATGRSTLAPSPSRVRLCSSCSLELFSWVLLPHKKISISKKIAVFLRFLGGGDSFDNSSFGLELKLTLRPREDSSKAIYPVCNGLSSVFKHTFLKLKSRRDGRTPERLGIKSEGALVPSILRFLRLRRLPRLAFRDSSHGVAISKLGSGGVIKTLISRRVLRHF